MLSGFRCGDGRSLRFWYGHQDLPPPPPLTQQQLQDLGDLGPTLPPASAGVDHTGYVSFSGPGQWEITLAQSGVRLGVLAVTVVEQ
jgi:hypothetical protein